MNSIKFERKKYIYQNKYSFSFQIEKNSFICQHIKMNFIQFERKKYIYLSERKKCIYLSQRKKYIYLSEINKYIFSFEILKGKNVFISEMQDRHVRCR